MTAPALPVARALGLGAALLGAGVFLVVAVGRALNFDETLALHAGFLLWSGDPARPALVMPWTALLGAWTHLVEDPATTLRYARLASAATVLLALVGFATAAGRGLGERAWIVALSLGTAAFVTAGLELRYDTAVLLALLLGATAALRAGADRAGAERAQGLALAALAAHGLKGLSLAAPLLFGALWLCPGPAARRRLGAAALAGLAAWLGLVTATGHLGGLLDDLRLYAGLAVDVPRVPRLEALGDDARPDAIFWLAAGAAGLATLPALRPGRASPPVPSPAPPAPVHADLVLLGVALVAASPWLTHPHPWPYMLALPVPFAAALVVRRLGDLARARPGLVWGLGGAAALLSRLGADPLEVHRRGLESRRDRLEGQLRTLRDLAQPGDRAFDPAGIAWFLRPCDAEWYLDTMFLPALEAGAWMATPPSPERCAWTVSSTRTEFLPAGRKAALDAGWEPFDGPLSLAPGDPRWGQRPADARPRRPVGNHQ